MDAMEDKPKIGWALDYYGDIVDSCVARFQSRVQSKYNLATFDGKKTAKLTARLSFSRRCLGKLGCLGFLQPDLC